MRAKLIIDKFANIDHAEIDLYDINVFIGPQASGKSLILKLMYYFNYIKRGIQAAPRLEERYRINELKCISLFRRFFIKSGWEKRAFTINYKTDEESITVSRKGDNEFLRVSFKPDIADRPSDEEKDKNTKNETIDQTFDDLYIPANRSFFAQLRDNVFTLLSANIRLDPFLVDFGAFYEYFRRQQSLFAHDDSGVYPILGGQWKSVNDDEFIVHSDNRVVPIESSSSGQQAVLPILMVLADLPPIVGSVFIEEPEAHIFPMSQKELIDLIGETYNQGRAKAFSITTHSPYILTAFNNLLLAGQVDLSKLIDIKRKKYEKKALNGESFACYLVDKGTVVSAMNKETGLIDAEVIDRVSETIEDEFSELLELYEDS